MKIHLHSKQGMYTVIAYNHKAITVATKHSQFIVPVSDFKSFAGGLWNSNVSKEVEDRFLQVVQPEKYALQLQQEQIILEMARSIDEQQKAIDEYYANCVEIDRLKTEEEEALEMEDYNSYLEYIEELENLPDPEAEEYKQWWLKVTDELDKTKTQMRKIAHQVYSQNLDFTNFTNREGIKFIIQQGHYDDHSFRFCWDPYGFVSNGHSDISSIFSRDDWGTINGGWIKIFEDDVVLYYKSGDYGVYDDAVAIECAKKLFPGKNIHSFAGRVWDNELEERFFDLPF